MDTWVIVVIILAVLAFIYWWNNGYMTEGLAQVGDVAIPNYQPMSSPPDNSWVYYPTQQIYLLPYDDLDWSDPYDVWMYYTYPEFYSQYYNVPIVKNNPWRQYYPAWNASWNRRWNPNWNQYTRPISDNSWRRFWTTDRLNRRFNRPSYNRPGYGGGGRPGVRPTPRPSPGGRPGGGIGGGIGGRPGGGIGGRPGGGMGGRPGGGMGGRPGGGMGGRPGGGMGGGHGGGGRGGGGRERFDQVEGGDYEPSIVETGDEGEGYGNPNDQGDNNLLRDVKKPNRSDAIYNRIDQFKQKFGSPSDNAPGSGCQASYFQ